MQGRRSGSWRAATGRPLRRGLLSMQQDTTELRDVTHREARESIEDGGRCGRLCCWCLGLLREYRYRMYRSLHSCRRLRGGGIPSERGERVGGGSNVTCNIARYVPYLQVE